MLSRERRERSRTNHPERRTKQAGFDAGDGREDAFLAKLDAAGELVYATYLGTGGDDAATSVPVDSKDRVIIGGYFSARGAILLARFDPAVNSLEPFAPPGSSPGGGVDAIAIGADDGIYATGTKLNASFPVTLHINRPRIGYKIF